MIENRGLERLCRRLGRAGPDASHFLAFARLDVFPQLKKFKIIVFLNEWKSMPGVPSPRAATRVV